MSHAADEYRDTAVNRGLLCLGGQKRSLRTHVGVSGLYTDFHTHWHLAFVMHERSGRHSSLERIPSPPDTETGTVSLMQHKCVTCYGENSGIIESFVAY